MTKTETNIAKKILRNHDEYRPELGFPIKVSDGYIITDGYKLIKTVENISGVQELIINPYESFISNVLSETSKNSGTQIKAPSISTVNNYVKNFKMNHPDERRVRFPLLNDVFVDAQYLKDMLTVLKKSTLHFADGLERKYKPIFFESPYGTGVLLPLRY